MTKSKNILFLFIVVIFLNCNVEKTQHQFTNDLIHESSPYLLQHAHNPVNWKAWNDSTLAIAKKENKLIVISVGYAACHWCHFMEKESFEDSIIAKTMNTNFINIKVDREERPDVDKVYMKAVQLMTGKGGWPLNVIALPDGRPIFGGTYFSKEQWKNTLKQISESYNNDPKKFYDFADKLEKGINETGMITVNTEKPDFTKEFINEEVNKWKNDFDLSFGGSDRAPKFMLPNNYQFLLRYAFQNNDTQLMKHIKTTLDKMAFGGIFDQINGGFSRYSTDKKWHIPHFEKMLYDNAQLVSLYTKAYQLTKNETYKNVVFETLEFVKRQLTSNEGTFYSSLDADSYNSKNILEEGAYYSWSKDELKSIIKTDFKLFSDYYNVNSYGLWEDEKYVLIKTKSDLTFTQKNNISLSELKNKKTNWKKSLQRIQQKRKKPRLDDKSLTSWSALMIIGYLDAYTVFNKKEYLEIAEKSAKLIIKNQLTAEGKLYHNYKNGKTTINGYLEDYAATAKAFIKIYEITANEIWLQKATLITEYAITNFYDRTSKMFFFTSKKEPSLISKTIEYQDNVIASSNSIMAKNLFSLSHHLDNKEYKEITTAMLNNVTSKIINNADSFSNWLNLMLNYTSPYYEVVIAGNDAKEMTTELHQNYLPNTLITYSDKESNLPLLKNRYSKNGTYIYVCLDNTCKLPVSSVKKALSFIQK